MKRSDAGYVLISVVVLSGVLITLAAISTTYMVTEARQSAIQYKKLKAYYIARSGAAITSKWISSMSTQELQSFISMRFPLTSEPKSFEEGSFQVSIHKTENELILESTGRIEHGRNVDGSPRYITDRAVAVMKREGTAISPIDTALYGINSLYIKGTVKGNIGTNSTASGAVTFDWGYSFSGSLIIPGGDPDQVLKYPSLSDGKPNIITTGVTRSYPTPSMPAFPSNLIRADDVYARSWPPHGPIEGNRYYENITIDDNVTLTINVGSTDTVIRVKNLDVRQGHIKIAGTGKLRLYIDNLISLKGSLNYLSSPDQVELYCNNPGKVAIGGETSIYGSLYLRSSTLSLENSAKIVGDVITSGDSVNLSGAAIINSGVLYAPNADISAGGAASIQGAAVGKAISLTGAANVTMTETSFSTRIPIISDGVSSLGFRLSYWK